jgi:tetratricopeptide (TPR) repeat protein
MARHYAILGSNDQASDAIKRALALCPDNRFILRSATRFHVHAGNPDVAHDLLRREEKTKLDPWLLAAEVAAATVAGRTSKLVKRARQLMTKYPPFQITELASAIATLELNAGNNKTALKLFKQSLLEPTDNSIAQVEWASRRIKNLQVEQKHLENPFSYEARAEALYLEGKWSESYRECLRWLDDEPYSTRPSLLGTFVTSVALEQYAQCEALARRSLRSNPNNQTLLNNLTFALASINKVEEAKEIHKLMSPSHFEEGDKISWLATGGLLLFRQGLAMEGRALYQQAIEQAKNDPDRRALASLFLAREEIRAGGKTGPADYEEAAKLIQQVKSAGMAKILDMALSRLKTQLETQNQQRSR